MNACIRLSFALLVAAPAPLAAQSFLEQFSYEGLRLSGVGLEVGVVVSNRLTTSVGGAVSVDAGLIAPKIRVLLGASYFKADFKDEEIADFERQLESVLPDTLDITIDLGTITWADLGFSLDLQYVPHPAGRIRPYAGLGVAVHFRDGDGPAIDGTFVESALDMVDAGLVASTGFELLLARTLMFTAAARGELTTELLTFAARAGLTYRIPYGGGK